MGLFTAILQLRSPSVTLGFYPSVMEMPTFLFSTFSAGCFPNCGCQWHWCLLGDCPSPHCSPFAHSFSRSTTSSSSTAAWYLVDMKFWYNILAFFLLLYSECQVPGCSKRMGSYCYNGVPDSRGVKENGYLFGSWFWKLGSPRACISM